MQQKRDKLGRIIPNYDRSSIGKKVAERIKKEKGDDFYSRIGTVGGSRRTRGYFGQLKDQGKADELKKLSKKGYEASEPKLKEYYQRGSKKGKGNKGGV